MKKQTNGHRWTNDELLKLISGWIEGKELDELADMFGCTRHGINKQVSRLRRDGVVLPRRQNGHLAGRRNQPWTQSEVEFLVRRRNDSVSAEQIGVELGRSFLAVQAMIQNLRKEGIDLRMLGCGVRKLWSADTLKGAVAGRGLLPPEEKNVQPIRLISK